MTHDDILKRVGLIEEILDLDDGLHPVSCNCAIKSRDDAHHLQTCPYRLLKETLRDIRRRSSNE